MASYDYGDYFDYDYNHENGSYYYYEESWQESARRNIFTYLAPFIIVLGTIGNVIAFVVLQSKSYRIQSTGFILSALAVVDTGMLNTGLLRNFIIECSEVDIRTFSVFSCRFHHFLTYFFSHASPMTIALMTVERVLSVWMPFRVKAICTRRHIAFVWAACILFLSLLNSHSFATVDLIETKYNDSDGSEISTYSCYYADGYHDFHKTAFHWVDAFFSSFLPVVIIFTGNILIIIKLSTATQTRQESLNAKSFKRSGSTVGSTKSTTIMLLTVSVVFLVCTLPLSIYFIGTGDANWWPKETPEDKAKLDFAYAVINTIFYINNAINFPLYFLAGSRFRRVMRKMFCSSCPSTFKRRSTVSVSSGSAGNGTAKYRPNDSNTEVTAM